MRYNPFTSHAKLTNTIILLLVIAVAICAYFGELKQWQDIAWLDIVGEGGIVLMTLSWIVALLISRPPGKVTTLLVLGLGLFMFSATLDLLDEWLKQPSQLWLTWFESLPAPFGMSLTSAGLYYWHQEQFVLNRQLRRREAHLREHEKVCPVTGLYRVNYLHSLMQQQQTEQQGGTLGVIDIRDFAKFNAQFGFSEGDRLLREISDLLVMNCRLNDVLCRYAGDCFIVLMPNTSQSQAKELLAQMKAALNHCAFKVAKSKGAQFQHILTATMAMDLAQDPVQQTSLLHQQLQQEKALVGAAVY
jgi:diguanylate cyclase (GGDEF)-like protein